VLVLPSKQEQRLLTVVLLELFKRRIEARCLSACDDSSSA
jgi:hypothetical protein